MRRRPGRPALARGRPLQSAAIGLFGLLAAGCVPPSYDRDLVTQLDREILALQQRNELLRESLLTCDEAGDPGTILPELVQVFSGTEVQVDKEGSRTLVTIPGDLLFSAGSTTVREEAAMVTDLLSTALNLHEDRDIIVLGHTDDQPLSSSLRRRFGSSWGLSTAQATGFMAALNGLGVSESRFTVGGRGSVEPLTSNDTPEGRERNRRVVVEIGPPPAEAPPALEEGG